jgi:hypothetical protein
MPTATRARLLPCLLAAAALAGCGRNLEMTGVQKAITRGIADQAGLEIVSVACPERPMKANDVFQCVAVPKGGGRLTIDVTQSDDQGTTTWKVARTEGLLDLSKIEASVQVGLKDQARVDATVSCGGRWKAAKAGDRFECAAKIRGGTQAAIVVTVTDNDGNINWATK